MGTGIFEFDKGWKKSVFREGVEEWNPVLASLNTVII